MSEVRRGGEFVCCMFARHRLRGIDSHARVGRFHRCYWANREVLLTPVSHSTILDPSVEEKPLNASRDSKTLTE